MTAIKGIVERITYTNQDNGFSVIKIKASGENELITVVGNLASVTVGSQLQIRGQWKHDPKFGRQFTVESYKESMPSSLVGIEKYLGSGLIKGIGPVYAKKIIECFKMDTIDIIENDPDRLLEVEGIGQKRIDMIKSGWEEQKEIKNVMIFLQSHGISATYAVKIFKNYGKKSIDVLNENPYRLADDIWGIGFKTADRIAANMGYQPDAYPRCKSAFMYLINEAGNSGHCYLLREELLEAAQELLEVEPLVLRRHLDSAVGEEALLITDGAVYVPAMYFSEVAVAKRITAIASQQSKYLVSDIDRAIAVIEKEEKISYDDIQKQGIKESVESKFMVLTGGPGTGKTTTTLAIIKVFQKLGASITLAAPTGRAAKRLSETTRMEAKTIHRLLEFKPGEGFNRNQDNPFPGDILILDESSMIDIILMHQVLKAVGDHMHVILVGDVDQLPSVGPGNVLRDIIDSGKVRVVTLERIFRQAQDSDIITNAHRINKGLFPELKPGRDSDFFFIEESEPEKITETIADLAKRRLPQYYKVDPVNDIQILTPMQRSETGAQNLNQVLQRVLNSNTECLTYGAVKYYLGDKVMQIKNNYDKNVFNGDIGIISRLHKDDQTISIDFEQGSVNYELSEFDELVLAYAVTVHKSQGSEYQVVIAPLTTQHYMMLQRNLLYTCVTRAKKIMILVGTKKAVFMAVKNNKIIKRNTRLSGLLTMGGQ